MTLELSNIVFCDFHFKTKFLFRDAYDILITNQNQTSSNKVDEKKNSYPKQLETMVASLREIFK